MLKGASHDGDPPAPECDLNATRPAIWLAGEGFCSVHKMSVSLTLPPGFWDRSVKACSQ